MFFQGSVLPFATRVCGEDDFTLIREDEEFLPGSLFGHYGRHDLLEWRVGGLIRRFGFFVEQQFPGQGLYGWPPGGQKQFPPLIVYPLGQGLLFERSGHVEAVEDRRLEGAPGLQKRQRP